MSGHDPDLRSYGRRHGRKLSPRQAALLRDRLPALRINLAAPPPAAPGGLFAPAPEAQKQTDATAPAGTERSEHARVLVGTRSAKRESRHPEAHAPDAAARSSASRSRGHLKAQQIWLEIGFGGGEHLLWQAERNPDVGLIGCEPFEEGVVKVLTGIEERGLANIRLHPDDARPLLRWLPEASLDRAFILFPDPWPKARHRKRRLVNAATLDLLARAMKPGAELRVATDIGDYLRTMLMAFGSCPHFIWQAEGTQDWRVRPADWPQTRYEAKAAAEGRRRYYLRFRRAGRP